ncbi:MAG: ATP-binding protein [Treponema sp.]|jgi:uncharacterized protein|nr:ATP-binding protein [Treponema sp.]
MQERQSFLEKLKKLKDTQIIKVISGVRRCGKSTLLKQFQDYLLENDVEKSQIIDINFEDLLNEPLHNYKKLYSHTTSLLIKDKMNYIFLDEIQLVENFQKVVDSLFIQKNVDLYITGSNAYLLSGELATLLSGRYIEIKMLPFSFAEYFSFVGGNKKEAWNSFFKYGGFPYASTLHDDQIRNDYLSSIYNTVLLKDIASRKKIGDIALLQDVVKFLFDNIGNIVSPKKIADSLTSVGRKTTSITVDNYINALMESFILYKASRYDVKGKEHLKSLEKYYLVDVGLRRLLIGDRNTDIGHILENIIYIELIRRGYNVYIGKIGSLEIDFTAEKSGEISYYQVAATVLDESTYAREIAPLKKVHDNFPKYILSLDEFITSEDGIKQLNVIDWLLA